MLLIGLVSNCAHTVCGSFSNVLQLEQDLMEPKSVVELYTFYASYSNSYDF